MFSMSRTADRCMINVTTRDILMPVRADTRTPYSQDVNSWATRYKKKGEVSRLVIVT